MIHMLSKFDLKQKNIEEFNEDYFRFIEIILNLGLIDSAGPIGQRIKNTPMDTAGDQDPEFYSIMSFRDREQLDAAYDYLLNSDITPEVQITHKAVQNAVANPVFTCWQDIG